MNIDKVFRDAENRIHNVRKGPYIKALCKALRRLIPDDECIRLDLGNNIIAEVDGVDIAVHLQCLLKDVPDTTSVIADSNLDECLRNEETAETDLSWVKIEDINL